MRYEQLLLFTGGVGSELVAGALVMFSIAMGCDAPPKDQDKEIVLCYSRSLNSSHQGQSFPSAQLLGVRFELATVVGDTHSFS